MRTILSILTFLLGIVCLGAAGNLESFTQIDLSQAVNMGFVDETARDGKGGWFDDGENDFRFFLVDRTQNVKPPEQVMICGVPFHIIDPESNNGKAIVVFGSKFKPEINLRSAGPFRIDRNVQSIYLLHATAWCKKGQTAAELQTVYDDNTKFSQKIIIGQNVSDWFRPQEVPHAIIGWQGITPSGSVCGIYFTSINNPHPEKKVREISFQGGQDDLNYALLAVTTASDSTRIQPVCQLKQVYSSPEKRPEAKPSKILNPMNFPSYPQNLEVKFANPTAAEKAKLTVPPLPQGKTFALTLRWDDCSKNHINQLRVMRKNNLRRTFMLHGFGKSYLEMAKELLKTGGCSIGNHSFKHIRYNGVPLNTIYEHIVRQQVLIESSLDTVCSSYVFPGGLSSPSPEECRTSGRSINAGGIYSGPFMSRGTHKAIGLDSRQMFPTYSFSANDRKPDEKLFVEGLNRMRLLSMRDPEVPRITFGIHSWQDEKGMEELDKLYSKYLCSPEFWN
ncbi:MAG: polysaccharide deacetylase family protein, partial [Victivallales bacterium]|nr:polysaccharide deacetylase family protein [Victivallales bacterium]